METPPFIATASPSCEVFDDCIPVQRERRVLSAFREHKADLSEPEGHEELHVAIPDIDVLVNNAGFSPVGQFDVDVFRRVIEMNLVGVMQL